MSFSTLNSSVTSLNLNSSITSFASANLSPSSSSSRRFNVSFSDVEIIELPITVGDGPSVGVPLTVDWEAQSRNVFPLEFFEEFRPKRRNKDHLRIKPETREKALLRNGVTKNEILEGAKKAKILRKERMDTMNQLRMLRLLEINYGTEDNDRKPRSGGDSSGSVRK